MKVTKEHLVEGFLKEPTVFQVVELKQEHDNPVYSYAGLALCYKNELIAVFYANNAIEVGRTRKLANLSEAELYAKGFAHALNRGPSLFLGSRVELKELGAVKIKGSGAYFVKEAISLLIKETETGVHEFIARII